MKKSTLTKAGKISVISCVVFVGAFIYMNLLVAFGQEGGDTLLDNPLLALGGVTLALSGISAFASGIIATFKYKDRSLLVFISTLIGFLITMLLLGEIVSPH